MEEHDPAVLKQWLPLNEAALAYGLSERTLRRRSVEGVGKPLDYGYLGKEIRVKPPAGYAPAGPAPADLPGEGLSLAVVEQFQGMIRFAEQQAEELRAERDTLRQQMDTLQEQRREEAGTMREEIGRLKGRLEAVEAELERARQRPPEASNLTDSAASHPPEAPRRRWWWQR